MLKDNLFDGASPHQMGAFVGGIGYITAWTEPRTNSFENRKEQKGISFENFDFKIFIFIYIFLLFGWTYFVDELLYRCIDIF